MYGIALDLGTSGFRAQLVDLKNKKVIQTVVTLRHPIPGANVIDHLTFAMKVGEAVTNKIILRAVKKLIDSFEVDKKDIEKISVCGNPTQLSLFQNIEIRDLAYAGESKQESLGVIPPKRDARIVEASKIFRDVLSLPNCCVMIPPAIKHEVGADALAMMIESDFLNEKGVSIVTDYGTNAEMAIKIGEKIYTASAAAGPAIEGQQIECGMLAVPGTVSNVYLEDGKWREVVLDESLNEARGPLVDPISGEIYDEGDHTPIALTGTGVVATIALGLETGIIKKLPKIVNGGPIKLYKNVYLTEKDVEEAGKAIGAIRAGHLTLMLEAKIDYNDLDSVYMSGASGTYVDASKAQKVGMVPWLAKRVYQVGNTSLLLAKDILLDEKLFDRVKEVAEQIKADHIMLATSDTFKKIFINEFAYWAQGMSMDQYNLALGIYNIPKLPEEKVEAKIQKIVKRDIRDPGEKGLHVVTNIGIKLVTEVEKCVDCGKCVEECPENSIRIVEENGKKLAYFDGETCLGMACKRCEEICPTRTLSLNNLRIM